MKGKPVKHGRRGGTDPAAAPKADRKTWQLCGQVARTLNEVFAGLSDDVLRDLQVVSVRPAPDASHVLVQVEPLPPSDVGDIPRILEHLARASGLLRSELAAAIQRRQTPGLSFEVALSRPEDEGTHEVPDRSEEEAAEDA